MAVYAAYFNERMRENGAGCQWKIEMNAREAGRSRNLFKCFRALAFDMLIIQSLMIVFLLLYLIL